MIDWSAFISVALASLIAAVVVVGFFSLGLRLIAPTDGEAGLARRTAGIACFVVCALAVLYGIYLIVPAFH